MFLINVLGLFYQRQKNLKTAFTVKTQEIFYVHSMPEKFENTTITGHLGKAGVFEFRSSVFVTE